MKKLIYSALATIIFIPSLSFFTDDSAKVLLSNTSCSVRRIQ
nr:hypothetical protein P5629_00180 [Bacillus subtilis]